MDLGRLDKSHYIFRGKIKESQIKQNSINSDKDLNEFIFKIFPDWDKKQKRLKIQFRNLQKDSERINFITNYNNKNQIGFDTIEFLEIPIMPYNSEDAINWRNWLVEQELNKDYFQYSILENKIEEINKKNGFRAYSEDVKVLSLQELIEMCYKKNGAKQSPAFWHLVAPNDLLPIKD
jgi:hypothetical protein